jgi:hypothetical protein
MANSIAIVACLFAMFINVGSEGTLSMYKKRFFIMLIVV